MYIKVQRRTAIHIISAFRTTSTQALLVIARTPPIDLLTKQRTQIAEEGREHKNRIQESMLTIWQKRWKTETSTAGWTRRLLPDYYLGTKEKMVSSTSTWRSFARAWVLWSLLSQVSPKRNWRLLHICRIRDDSDHTFFHCPRWRQIRERVERKVGVMRPKI